VMLYIEGEGVEDSEHAIVPHHELHDPSLNGRLS
jgi:hypothetical protein